jgi:hypothetical protein
MTRFLRHSPTNIQQLDDGLCKSDHLEQGKQINLALVQWAIAFDD